MSETAKPSGSLGGSAAVAGGVRAADSASDEELLRRFAEWRDRAALGELAERYERYLLGVAMGLLGGREDRARDAVQEVWVRVIRSAGSFRFDSSVKTWLYRVTVNRCRDEHRRAKVGARSAVSLNGMLEDGARGKVGFGEAVHDTAGGDGAVAGLIGAIGILTDDEREVVVLCYHRGLSHSEAAAALDLPMGTLKTRLYRAVKRLASLLNSDGKPETGGAVGLTMETDPVRSGMTMKKTESGG